MNAVKNKIKIEMFTRVRGDGGGMPGKLYQFIM